MSKGGLKVNFSAVRSKYTSRICNGCHGVGKVVKVTFPETFYFNHKELSTKYHERWYCEDCAKKLIEAIENAEVEE